MKIFVVLFIFQFCNSSIILKDPRQLNNDIDKKNNVNSQFKNIESQNKSFQEAIDKKIQDKMMENSQNNNSDQPQGQQSSQQTQKSQPKAQEQKETSNIDLPNEGDQDTVEDNKTQNNKDKENVVDPSDREKKKDFLVAGDAVIIKNTQQDEQKIEKLKPQQHIIMKNLNRHNQVAYAEPTADEDQKKDGTTSSKPKKDIQVAKKIEDLTITKDGQQVEIDKQVKVNLNDPQRKKSEEVILSKIGSSKENLTIIKSVLSIFILTYSF